MEQKAKLLRKLSLISTTEAGSGHPTSCLSAADLGAVLFEKYFHYDLENPLDIHNDRFVLSKGHAAPLFYALYGMSGAFPLDDLKDLRKLSSNLEGHPTPHFKYTDAATGSLGQGLSIAAGMAYVSQKEKLGFKTFVMLGDGEMAEGQIWEAANFASHNSLQDLVVIADVNRLGQSDPTMFEHQMEKYVARFEAFGFEVVSIDGHNISEIDKAFASAVTNTSNKPFAIIARTFKGRGISFLEDKDNWHGKALKKEDLQKALEELGEVDDSLRFELGKPAVILEGSEGSIQSGTKDSSTLSQNDMIFDKEIATREVYGQMLAKLGVVDKRIYAIDGDMKNSTFSQDFLKAHPDRFIEGYIAEQNMVGVAVGISRLGKIPFVSTFSAFLTRACDQIRMAAVSQANISFCGSHVGVSIGEDGPSQMGLEDIAMFGAIPDSIIFQPSDGMSTAKVLPLIAKHKGISYIRTLRPKTPILYKNDDQFEIGGSKILRSSSEDLVTIIATGITVHEALKAHEALEQEGIHVRIVDCYSIKPIDQKTLKLCLSETMKPIIVTVEDHFSHGGMGDFVLEALAHENAHVEKLAVTHISRSGTPVELLRDAQIDAGSIVSTVKRLLH